MPSTGYDGCVARIKLIWQSKLVLLQEIIGHMHAATDNALALIKAAVPLLSALRARRRQSASPVPRPRLAAPAPPPQ